MTDTMSVKMQTDSGAKKIDDWPIQADPHGEMTAYRKGKGAKNTTAGQTKSSDSTINEVKTPHKNTSETRDEVIPRCDVSVGGHKN